MESADIQKKLAGSSPETVTSVASLILDEFLSELAKEEGFAEVALRLRKVVIEDGVFAEPAIRSALFLDPI